MEAANSGQSRSQPIQCHLPSIISTIKASSSYHNLYSKIEHAKYIVFESYDQTFLILMILFTDDWLVTGGYLRWSHGLSARIRVWQIYSNIRIYWSRIYIRTFIRINFSFTNIFGHSFVSNLFVRIYSDIRW